MALYFAPSAGRHHISQARILYVLGNHIWSYSAGRGVTLYFGPDRSGIDLEVATVRRGEDIFVIHAMKIRRSLIAEYRRRLP